MRILALDTTTRTGSVALADDGVVVREMASDPSQPPASRLPGELMALLELERRSLGEIDIYAVATGPGSFTGMRVGIATMQGLAFATGKPLIGVSGFDALAAIAASGGRVATWVDAWRGEVYAALYEDGREIEAPTVEHPDAILARLGADPTLFIGDGAETHRAAIVRAAGERARFAESATPLTAGAIALLATAAAQGGDLPAPHAIRPLYVRRPDAELARDVRAAR